MSVPWPQSRMSFAPSFGLAVRAPAPFVIPGAAEDCILADIAFDPVVPLLPVDLVVPRLALDKVVALAAARLVVAGSGVDSVVSGAAEQPVVHVGAAALAAAHLDRSKGRS